MKKSDLRTGMIVTFNCGRKGRVMIGVRSYGIDSDIISYSTRGYCSDIVKVEMCDYMGDLLEFDARNKKTLWERVTETLAEKEKREILEQMEEITERLYKLEVK